MSVESAVAEFVDEMQSISNRNGCTISINGKAIASPEHLEAADDDLSPEEKATRDAEKLAALQERWHARTAEIEKDLGHASVEVVKHTNLLKEAKRLATQLAEELEHRYASGEPTELPKPGCDLRQTEMFDDEEDGEDNRWKVVPMSAFRTLTPSILKSLAEAGIENIGQLESFTGDLKDGRDLTDISGIGPKANDTILEALDGFWTAWRRGADEALVAYT